MTSRCRGNTGRWLICRGYLAALIEADCKSWSEVWCATVRDMLTEQQRQVYVPKTDRWGLELDAAIAAAQFEMDQQH